MNNPSAEHDRLSKMPTIDEAVQRYEQMEQAIKQQLTQSIPSLANWEDTHDSVGRAGCLNGDGETHNLSNQIVRVQLPDQQFEQAVKAVGEVVKQYGFNEKPTQFRNSPGKHFTSFQNPADSSSVFFAASKRVVVQVKVGCHLTVDAKKRGQPRES